MSSLELLVRARVKDLGGFEVRRSLPSPTHHMVGPFIFFDHMGPAEFAPGADGINVRPHPHVNLATVTYLFEGTILHRDSLGSNQLIKPGAINWMIAGRGIVHSERTPNGLKAESRRIHGIQLWVALPTEHEEMEPQFSHHPKATLPEFKIDNVALKLLLGTAFGHSSPVPVLSDLLYVEARMPAGSRLTVPCEGDRELAAYVVKGEVFTNGEHADNASLAIAKTGDDLTIEAKAESLVMLVGGASLGIRWIEWNFVTSSPERMTEVKALWKQGPSATNERFPLVPGDDQEFIPLPAEPGAN